MRCNNVWSWLCLILGAATTAGCASVPGLTSLMPGGVAKPNQTLDAQVSLARLSERQGDARTAEQIYQVVLTKDPQNQLALHRLGVLAAKSGDPEKAAEYFNAAAQVGPPSPELLNDIGFNLLGMGRLQEAEALFRQAIAADPQNQSARNNLGLVLGETRRYDESLAEFRRGGKGEAEAQANFAYAQTQAGDLAGAKSSYHRALTLNNELKPAAEALMQLARHPSVTGEPDGTTVSKAFGRPGRRGALAPDIKSLPELAREGRGSAIFESVTERDRMTGRVKTVRFSGETSDAAKQSVHVQDVGVGGEFDSNPTVANHRSSADESVSGPGSQKTNVAATAGGSFVLSRVFRFPTRVEPAPTTEIHRRPAADKSPAARSASRISTALPNPARLADAAVPPPAQPRPGRRASLDQRAMNTSPVAAFEAPATPAADHPQAQQSAALMPPADGSAASSAAVFAAPALFLSSTPGSATNSPWQTPTWTPDFGAASGAGNAVPPSPPEGTVVPASPLTNLAP